MRAINITAFGGPEVLQLSEQPVPAFKAGELLIKVQAAGVNRPDVLQRAGHYPVPPGASALPGLEIAGEIVDGDFSDSGWRKGDLVCALVQGGAYAEYCTAPAALCLPVPAGWSVLEAASLPETFFTVWSNVFDRCHLAPGETLLVQGGTSGIGVAAIQIAAALGHRVFATAGSDEKCRACEVLGAERGINYRTEDFVEAVKTATQGKGVDVILDMVAGDYIQRELNCLADDGRLVFIAMLGGAKANVHFGQVLLRRLTITGSTLRPRPVAFKAAIASQLRAHVWPLLGGGKIKPVIFRTFPLEQAAQAHALMESNAHIGKIMLSL
ncbi:NAD(P)H quinone oxidoreductase, PIG3 family protein [Collimonas fungivorans]|uniref:NAD(P)H quinone oxidoreductase, PIG3 family protein n=1 Tax=Collimonas fungivorans TaxID=158899 RepID=A0A127PBK8_9BURK|nr:NAD(P)H-quinone oxidoreductase [Collimonas fungivorans]AMO95148.1 NAD(P)H quinone oxidoreductase, PIG3 family protein [Collimonas fungivorans]